jgi:hypothetical protein
MPSPIVGFLLSAGMACWLLPSAIHSLPQDVVSTASMEIVTSSKDLFISSLLEGNAD